MSLNNPNQTRGYDFWSFSGPGLDRDIAPKYRARSPVSTQDEVERNARRLSFFEKPGDVAAARRASRSVSRDPSARMSVGSSSEETAVEEYDEKKVMEGEKGQERGLLTVPRGRQ